MNPLQIEDRGLLIPPEYLAGISRQVRVRSIRGGIVIESADQAEARDELHSMVERLRAVAADSAPEIAGSVNTIPNDTLLALKLSDESAAAEIRLAAAVKLYELGRLSSGAAARLAGLPRVLFLSKLADYGVDTFCLSGDELKRQTHLA